MASDLALAVDPTRVFMINGQVCPLLTATGLPGVGAGLQIVVGTSGKVFRMMGWDISSQAAGISEFVFRDGGGAGTIKYARTPVPSNASATPVFQKPIIRSGWFDLTVSNSLYMDVFTNNISINLYYILYTP